MQTPRTDEVLIPEKSDRAVNSKRQVASQQSFRERSKVGPVTQSYYSGLPRSLAFATSLHNRINSLEENLNCHYITVSQVLKHKVA